MSDTDRSVWDIMKDELDEVMMHVDGLDVPQKLKTIIEAKLYAQEVAAERVNDTVTSHLSWAQYYDYVFESGPILDPWFWEVLYSELSNIYPQWNASHFAALKMSINPDPMYMRINVQGIKPMKNDGETMPEFVALAHDMGLDITLLQPFRIALSLEHLDPLNDMIKTVFGPEYDLFSLMSEHDSFPQHDVVLS
tara:strand:- start:949 stop:1530 length:582 start_codon:yes stop_codon:yes gene_type:complete